MVAADWREAAETTARLQRIRARGGPARGGRRNADPGVARGRRRQRAAPRQQSALRSRAGACRSVGRRNSAVARRRTAAAAPVGGPRSAGRCTNGTTTQRIARTLGAALRIETNGGDFDVELDYEHAPLTAEYFRRQAAAGALDGARFTTVAPNGYIVADARLGSVRSEINSQPFLRGSLGLLRTGAVSSPGEFFFCLTALPLADSRYVNFGRLASGDKLLDRIAAGTVIRSVRQLR